MIYNSCNSFVERWLWVSTDALTYIAYSSGPYNFMALNKTTIPGRSGSFLILFYKGDEGERLLTCVHYFVCQLVL